MSESDWTAVRLGDDLRSDHPPDDVLESGLSRSLDDVLEPGSPRPPDDALEPESPRPPDDVLERESSRSLDDVPEPESPGPPDCVPEHESPHVPEREADRVPDDLLEPEPGHDSEAPWAPAQRPSQRRPSAPRSGQPWADTDYEGILAAAREGVTDLEDVAARIGRSRQAVWSKAKRLLPVAERPAPSTGS